MNFDAICDSELLLIYVVVVVFVEFLYKKRILKIY